ncbi:MAG: hypothetical protein NTW21_32920 [Verrucomicrobia bacterium]|nr:hypothetical protein [Verrucomicrobiota bacterium]
MTSQQTRIACVAGLASIAVFCAVLWLRRDKAQAGNEAWRAEWQKPAPVGSSPPAPPPAVDDDGLPVLAAAPDDAGIAASRAFSAALLPVDDAALSADEKARQNAAMATFLREYRKLGPDAAWESLQQFVKRAPERWQPALQLELSAGWFAQGFFEESRELSAQLWKRLRERRDVNAVLIADQAAARLLDLGIGRGDAEELRRLVVENDGRPYHGSLEGKLMRAAQAAWLLGHTGAQNVACGPRALNAILDYQRADYTPIRLDKITGDYIATGLPMTEVQAFAGKLGWAAQMVRRTNQAAPIPVPAVLHAQAGHYAAILAADEEKGQYFLEDRGLDFAGWVSRDAVDRLSSGNFVIAAGAMPAGYQSLSESEGRNLFGRDGAHGVGNTGESVAGGPTAGGDDGGSCGMARYTFLPQLAAFRLMDKPVGYSPPFGPEVRFTLTYHDQDEDHPTSPAFSNAGRMWNVNWISWVVPPTGTLTNASILKIRIMGGGTVNETYSTSSQKFGPHDRHFSTSRKISATRYERSLPDGSMEIYAAPGNAANPTLIMLSEYRDPQGNALVFHYDSLLRLDLVTDAAGKQTHLYYDLGPSSLLITRVVDRFNRTATLAYNAAGQLKSVTDVINLQSVFTYGVSGDSIQTLQTPYGTTTFAVTGSLTTGNGSSERSVTVTDPQGDREKVLFRDVDSGATGITPTSFPPRTAFVGGQKVDFFAETARLQFRNSFYWGKIAMAMAPDDIKAARNYRWLSNKNAKVQPILESIREPLEDPVWFNYPGMSGARTTDVNGYPNYPGKGARPDKILRVLADGSPQIVQMTHNPLGLPTKTIDPLGRTTEFTYAANGLDLTEARQTTGGASQRLTAVTYNSQHLPLTATDAAGQVTTFTYNARGQTLTVTNPNNEVTTFTYDADGFLTTIDGPLAGTGDRTLLTYDSTSNGLPRTVTGPDGYALTYTYDSFDRVKKITYPDATFEQFDYDLLDRIGRFDRFGRMTVYAYNKIRQLVKVTDPEERAVTFDWCKCGDLAGITDPLGRTTRWVRDVQGRVTAKIYADGSRVGYRYEPQTSRLAQRIDEKNQTTLYSYNIDNTLRTVAYPDATVATPTVSYTYDSIFKRIATMTDGIGTTTYAYHPITGGAAIGAGLPASVDGPWANDTITYVYDKLGRPTTRSINGTPETVAFDATGRPTTVINPLGTFNYTYVPNTFRLASAARSGGPSTAFSYWDNAHDRRLSGISNSKPGGAALSTFNYTYDAAGRIKTWSQQNDSTTAQTWDLSYDNADQLAAAVVKQGVATLKSSAWEYDTASNRTKETVNGTATNFSYNTLNEMTHVSSTLTPATYEWDAENRLTAVNQGAARTEFTYDGLGRRVKITEKTSGTITSTTSYLWAGLAICERRDATGGIVQQRYFAQGFQGVTGTPAGIHLYTRDHLGSIREITDTAGTIKERISYDAWGKPTFSNATPLSSFAFTGHFWHGRSGLHLAPYRVYSVMHGRWLSRDPVAENGGMNLYGYADNNPINRFDPLGLWSPQAHDALLQHAFEGKIPQREIDILKWASAGFDVLTFQEKYSNMHCMGTKGQTILDAKAACKKSIDDTISNAKDACGSGNRSEAMNLLGQALHTIMDQYSPMHTDSNGNPISYDPNSPNGKKHSKSDAHGEERTLDITPEIYKQQDKLLNDAYFEVFGL